MPTRFLTDGELAQLSGFPAGIAGEDLVTYFSLEPSDRRWVVAGHRGQASRLGLALQLCALPWLGFVPDDLTAAPPAAVGRLAGQLGLDPAVLADYGGWQERTRTEHLREVLARLGWRAAGPGDIKALEDFLADRALEHDSPSLLVRLACEHLRAARVVRPGVDRLQRWVATARQRAWAATALRLGPVFAPERRRAELDGLLVTDPDLGMSRLAWLRRGATSATPEVIKAELGKLAYLRALGADTLDLSMLPPGRRRFLAQVGRRSTAQALTRTDPGRRYPVLLATLAEAAVEVLDELVLLFDQGLSSSDSRAATSSTSGWRNEQRTPSAGKSSSISCWRSWPTPACPTRPSAGCCGAGWAWTPCARLVCRPAVAPGATPGAWSCSGPATPTCGPLPQACSPP